MRRFHSQLSPAIRHFHSAPIARAEVIVVKDGKPVVITPNTEPNTHYDSTKPPTPPIVNQTPIVTQPVTPATPVIVTQPIPSQPTQQAPVININKPAAPESSSYSRSSSRRSGSTLRSRLASFFVGAALTGGFGYYRLQSDIWNSAAAVESQIATMAPQLEKVRQLESQINQLTKRVEALEKTPTPATTKK